MHEDTVAIYRAPALRSNFSEQPPVQRNPSSADRPRMCSYNRINGTCASENRWLLTDILRTEWGFDGAAVADWGAVSNRAAAASIVLQRNENNTLPLRQGITVAVLGEFAEKPRNQGGGSSHVNAPHVDVPLEELRRALGEDRVLYAGLWLLT
jgi:beta-glucosidase-like glycosyl hydrolase